MAATRITLNHREIQTYLDGGHGVEAMLEQHAGRALAAAQADAQGFEVTGGYHDSLHVETEHTDRMVKRVVADVDYALVVEANHGTLSRAMDSA